MGVANAVPKLIAYQRRAGRASCPGQNVQPSAGRVRHHVLCSRVGESGRAVFPAPTVIEREVCRHYRVAVVGRAPTVLERYYAISVERRLKHPGVIAIAATARNEMSAK